MVGGKVGLVGAAVVVVLTPPGYLGYLAWAMPHPLHVPGGATALSLAPVPARATRTRADAASGPPTLAPASASETAAVPRTGAGGGERAGPDGRHPVPVGPTPGFVVVAPRGRHAYVANREAGAVTVVDTAVNRVTATIPVPLGPPQYLAFSPDGRTVYISVWDEARTVAAVGVLDTTTNAVVATVPMRSRPFLAAVTPDGRQLYVPNHDSGTISVVDTATNTVTAEIRVAAHPHWVEFSPDGRRAYTANHESNLVTVIDTASRHRGGGGACRAEPAQRGGAPDPAARRGRELRLRLGDDDRHRLRAGGGDDRGWATGRRTSPGRRTAGSPTWPTSTTTRSR